METDYNLRSLGIDDTKIVTFRNESVGNIVSESNIIFRYWVCRPMAYNKFYTR